MRILDLHGADKALIHQAAELLVEGFSNDWPDAWPDLPSAQEEVSECLREGWLARAAVASSGQLLGWAGARPSYGGNVWELHPLVAGKLHRGQGVGRALVKDIEAAVAALGGLTLLAGSDDETGMTSLFGLDLYDNLWEQIENIRNVRNHPYSFYQRLGFTIVGVIPDANGMGKPDILLAKRVRSQEA